MGVLAMQVTHILCSLQNQSHIRCAGSLTSDLIAGSQAYGDAWVRLQAVQGVVEALECGGF